MLKTVKKQMCIRNHDTWITGRYSNGACKVCDRKRHRDFYFAHPEYKQNTNEVVKRLMRYGITKDQYTQLLITQQYKCQICKKHQDTLNKSLSVDHDHKTGKVRGLLCGSCNLFLGLARDNTQLLQAGIEYLNLK